MSIKDFSSTNIQSISWKKANLRNANFAQTDAGISLFWVVVQGIELCCISIASGISAVVSAILSTSLLSSKSITQFTVFPGLSAFVLFLLSLWLTTKRGFILPLGMSATAIFIVSALSPIVQTSLLIGIAAYVAFSVISGLISLLLFGLVTACTKTINKGVEIFFLYLYLYLHLAFSS